MIQSENDSSSQTMPFETKANSEKMGLSGEQYEKSQILFVKGDLGTKTMAIKVLLLQPFIGQKIQQLQVL